MNYSSQSKNDNTEETSVSVLDLEFDIFKYQAFANNTNKLFIDHFSRHSLTYILTLSVRKERQNRYVFKGRLIIIMLCCQINPFKVIIQTNNLFHLSFSLFNTFSL